MKRLDAGISGSFDSKTELEWNELDLPNRWRRVIEVLAPGSGPREAQLLALREHGFLDSRRNLIVSAPTNAGKSLVGLLLLLQALDGGRRALLLEPLRALAQEKYEQLVRAVGPLGGCLGNRFTVRLSTGDYRLENEALSDPPPGQGELIVATPERAEAIMRSAANEPWLSSIGAVCVDEAHLIRSPKRGPILEFLVTSFLCRPSPPRICLLSASMGNLDRAKNWLAPCDIVSVTERYPPLTKEVLQLDTDMGANQVVTDLVSEALRDPSHSALVFVYQTRSTEVLAELLTSQLDGGSLGPSGALPYHSRMSVAKRESVRTEFLEGRSRCVVATTALALGVNLPATDVFVRDTTFPGVGEVAIEDLLQMMGRAGRGDTPGRAVAVVRASDPRNGEDLARGLREEKVPELVSSFAVRDFACHTRRSQTMADSAATAVAAYLAWRGELGATDQELRELFSRSLGGQDLAELLGPALTWLHDPARMLAFTDEAGRFRLTSLGSAAARAVLPLSVAAGFAQLLRDLMAVDPGDEWLERWQPLDHLICLELLGDHGMLTRRFSERLVAQIDAWMEENPASVPVIYCEGIRGVRGFSRASEVLGSLGLFPVAGGVDPDEWSRQTAYLATLRSIVLYQRGMGVRIEDIERRWGVTGFEGIEERYRDTLLWLLSGLGNTLEVPCFYYHLREECHATPERVASVKRCLRRMRFQTLELREQLKYCSPLGPVLRSIRRTRAGAKGASVGLRTIRRLEGSGIDTLSKLAVLTVDDLLKLGVRRDFAAQIHGYAVRRMN